MSKKIEAKLQVKLKRELNDGEQLTDRELFRDYITDCMSRMGHVQ